MTIGREAIVAGTATRARGYRWVICGLLVAATAISYVDRQMIGVLKPVLLGRAIVNLPILGVQHVDTLPLAVRPIGLATAGHQAFPANLLTLPSDLFPRAAIGSVVGIGGTAGAIGGMLIAKFVGYVLEVTGSYALIFAVAGGACFAALIALHLLSPRLAPVNPANEECL